MKRDAIVIGTDDNVATALRNLDTGEQASVGIAHQIISIAMVEPVEYGHKFAIREISKGDDIVKYGEIIGRATADIATGAHVHIQNVESLRGRGDLNATVA
jgi:altronate dehydratase small subunit